jgi:hypothetical protein
MTSCMRDHLVYAYLQMGQDGKAQAVLQEMRGIGGFTERFIAGPYALAVSVTRSSAATGMWQRPYQCGRARWRMSKP